MEQVNRDYPNLMYLFRQILTLNEVGGNKELIYKFSDPDGVMTGKSGWSFGLTQFDINNNGSAALCLMECGFSKSEIAALKQQTIDIRKCDMRLADNKKTVDTWDNKQLLDCFGRVKVCSETAGFKLMDDAAFLFAADYHNQMYISKNGPFYNWAKDHQGHITADDILKFRLDQTWGKKRPDDVQRRYDNMKRIMAKR